MKKTIRAILTLAVIAIGLGGAAALIASREEAKIAPPKEQAVLVTVTTAISGPERVLVNAMGTVKPSRELTVVPQVSGRLIELNQKLVPGGFIEEGEVLVKIDDRDYVAARRQAWAQVEQAKAARKLEQGRQTVARREWDLMEGENRGRGDLALRKPQLADAKARVNAAMAAYSQAKLSVERCEIKAPFDALVTMETAELDQLVSQQTQLARLVGAHIYWVQVSIPVNQLGRIKLPNDYGIGGAKVKVLQELGGGASGSWDGKVIRLLGDLEPAGRMARLIVEVDNPLGLGARDQDQPLPLLINSYVRVEIEGGEIERAFVVPRAAIREGDQIYVMNENDQLDVRKPKIAWRQQGQVLITEGLTDGERIVTSHVSTPIPGIKLRVNPVVESE